MKLRVEEIPCFHLIKKRKVRCACRKEVLMSGLTCISVCRLYTTLGLTVSRGWHSEQTSNLVSILVLWDISLLPHHGKPRKKREIKVMLTLFDTHYLNFNSFSSFLTGVLLTLCLKNTVSGFYNLQTRKNCSYLRIMSKLAPQIVYKY